MWKPLPIRPAKDHSWLGELPGQDVLFLLLLRCYDAGMKKLSILLLAFGALMITLAADNPSLRLVWDPNPVEDGLAGYRFYSGPSSRNYTNSVTLPFGRLMTNYPPVTNYSQVPPYPRIEHIDTNATIWFSLTAYSTNGLESDFSNEVNVNPDFWRTNRIMGVASARMKP